MAFSDTLSSLPADKQALYIREIQRAKANYANGYRADFVRASLARTKNRMDLERAILDAKVNLQESEGKDWRTVKQTLQRDAASIRAAIVRVNADGSDRAAQVLRSVAGRVINMDSGSVATTVWQSLAGGPNDVGMVTGYESYLPEILEQARSTYPPPPKNLPAMTQQKLSELEARAEAVKAARQGLTAVLDAQLRMAQSEAPPPRALLRATWDGLNQISLDDVAGSPEDMMSGYARSLAADPVYQTLAAAAEGDEFNTTGSRGWEAWNAPQTRKLLAQAVADPRFRTWADERGFNIGVANEGGYIEGADDKKAIRAFRREALGEDKLVRNPLRPVGEVTVAETVPTGEPPAQLPSGQLQGVQVGDKTYLRKPDGRVYLWDEAASKPVETVDFPSDLRDAKWEVLDPDESDPESLKALRAEAAKPAMAEIPAVDRRYTVAGEILPSRMDDPAGTVRMLTPTGVRVIPAEQVEATQVMSQRKPMAESIQDLAQRIRGRRAAALQAQAAAVPVDERAETRMSPVQRAIEMTPVSAPVDEPATRRERIARQEAVSRAESLGPPSYDVESLVKSGRRTRLDRLIAAPEGGPATLYDSPEDLEEARKAARLRLESGTSDDPRRDLAVSIAAMGDQTRRPVNPMRKIPAQPAEVPFAPQTMQPQVVPPTPKQMGIDIPESSRRSEMLIGDVTKMTPQTLTPEQKTDLMSDEEIRARRIREERAARLRSRLLAE